MPALGFILTQTLLLSAEWRGWRRLHRAAKSRKHFCIHLVGLGQDASRPRILTNTHGLHQSDFYFALFQALEQPLLIAATGFRSEEHTSELQSHHDLVCRLLLEKKKKKN